MSLDQNTLTAWLLHPLKAMMLFLIPFPACLRSRRHPIHGARSNKGLGWNLGGTEAIKSKMLS